MNTTNLPRPELRGRGRVLYRCHSCGDMADPADCVVRDGKSYHLYCPKEAMTDGR